MEHIRWFAPIVAVFLQRFLFDLGGFINEENACRGDAIMNQGGTHSSRDHDWAKAL